jgi:hypothetical protein
MAVPNDAKVGRVQVGGRQNLVDSLKSQKVSVKERDISADDERTLLPVLTLEGFHVHGREDAC